MPYVGVGAQKASTNLTGTPMLRAYIAIAASIMFVFCITALGVHHSERRFNKYNKVSLDEVHKSDSHAIQENIKSENIKKYLRIFTKEPHIAGMEANKKVAYAIAEAWTKAGLEDVHTLPYEVLLSYPDFNNPNSVIIANTSGKVIFKSKGVSPVIIPDEQSGKYAGHQWLAYASNGSVSADVVYLNRGNEIDFKNLKLMGVDVKGKIALMRYGHGFRGDKVYKAQQAGAIGAILFSDTSDVARDGIDNATFSWYSYERLKINVISDHVYPKTIWMPNEAVQRGSLMHGDGDPLSPYYPSKKELFKSRTIEEAKNSGVLPSIPVLPVSYTTALEILKRMSGRPAPTDWQGRVGGNLTYRIGPGFSNGEKLSINVHSELKTKRIRNVIGYIRGSEEPDRYVMLGNHFDAWAYGSIDPNSGTAVLAEVARAMMQTINETSWRPARTIVFNAWDAEEFGLIGSTEFVEEFVNLLQKRAIVYINMDCIQGNSSLHVDAVPMIEHIAIEAAKNVVNPSKQERSRGRKTVYDTWVKTFPDKKTGLPRIRVPGGSSDHAPFLNFAGVPVINFNFKNFTTFDTYPLYHTMYETQFTNVHLMDTDDLSTHRSVGQYWAELAKKFADEVILPLNTTHLATVMLDSYLPQLKVTISGINVSRTDFETIRTQFALLTKSTQDLLTMSIKFQETMKFTRNSFSQNPYDSKHVNAVNERLISTEKCFINPRGVSTHNPSGRHVLFSVSDTDSYSNSMMAGVQNATESIFCLTLSTAGFLIIGMNITTNQTLPITLSILTLPILTNQTQSLLLKCDSVLVDKGSGRTVHLIAEFQIYKYETAPSKEKLREIVNQISIVQYSVICVFNTLRDVI